MQQKAVLHNRFDIEIYDVETGKIEYVKGENIILNQMWTRLCGGSAYFSYIGVGTGSGTLSPTRTELFSQLAVKSAENVETVYDTDTTGHVTKKITFSENEAIGLWTEVGIAYSSLSSRYVTHALFTDSEGQPIAINKTGKRIITVYATVYAEVLPPEAPNQFMVGVRSKNMLLKYLLSINWVSPYFKFTTLLEPDGSPSTIGMIYGSLSSTWSSDVSNKRRYTNLARLSVINGNAPIRGILVGDKNEFFGGTTLPNSIFPGKDFLGIAIGTGDGANDEFNFPLAFIKPGSETIYVNSVPQTRGVDYTVRYGIRGGDTILVDTLDSENTLASGLETVEEVVVLPQPSGEEVDITSIEIKNGSSVSDRMTSYDIKLSLDGENWVNAGSSGSWSTNAVATLNAFTPAKHKYLKANFVGASISAALTYLKVYATPPATKHIKFTTPPANGAVITADFSVEYIPKSENFVLDVQAEVMFGEG